jgi:hypothetical protein
MLRLYLLVRDGVRRSTQQYINGTISPFTFPDLQIDLAKLFG